MNNLTQEQRKRIEENRRKALEIRAAKANKLSITYNNEHVSNVGISPIKQNNPYPLNTNNFSSTSSSSNGHNSINTINNKIDINNTSPIKFNNLNSINKNENNVLTATTPKEYINGSCILISRKRFCVNIGYNKELIEIFKTIPSRMYDAQTKKWNFLIKDHNKLISLIKPLQANILISPLPKTIVKIFENAPDTLQIKDHDLSSLDPVLYNSLFPFQKEGVNFGIQRGGKVLIADDMGLGKTIQAIAIVNYYNKDWPLLIVTPSSVRYSWAEAFYTWLPSLEAEEISIINSSKDHIPNNKVIILSYDMLSKKRTDIEKRNFKSIIIDESHFLKNSKAARTQAAQNIMKNMKRIIMLTGTPALSRPIELFTQISALSPKNFFSYVQYGIRYCNGKKNQWGWNFNGSSNVEELNLLLKETVMIRRLKSEVIKQLPSKCRQLIILDPSRISLKNKGFIAMALKLKDENLKYNARRSALLHFFHETGLVKLPAICEYICDLLEADKKFLCFAHHREVMDGISHVIQAKSVDFIRIDGSVSSEERKSLCEKFQYNENCKVALLSITAACTGITLTAASLVIFAELFWNPGVLTQAEDRAHRIGQEDSVLIQYLVAKGTSDDEIWPLVQRKLDVLNKVGLSKDNFKNADTIDTNHSFQTKLENFWEELMLATEIEDDIENNPKRLKL